MNKEKILEQGSKYANENWNVDDNPNEHDNAHDDFIAGALWAVKNCSIPDVGGSFCDKFVVNKEYPSLYRSKCGHHRMDH